MAPAAGPTATDDTGFESLATPSDFSYRMPPGDRRGQSVRDGYAGVAGQSADAAGPRPDRGGLEPRTPSVLDYVTVERGRPRSQRVTPDDATTMIMEQLDSLQNLVMSQPAPSMSPSVSDRRASESPAVAGAVATEGQPSRQRPTLPTLKLGTYDGRTSFDTFLAKFENCSDYYGWKDRERLCHLRASLEKDAGQVPVSYTHLTLPTKRIV